MIGTYNRLNLHITASNIAVIKAASRKLRPEARKDHKSRALRHNFYQTMLDHHANAQRLYRAVVSGDLASTCPDCGEDRDEADSTWQQWQCSCCGGWIDKH